MIVTTEDTAKLTPKIKDRPNLNIFLNSSFLFSSCIVSQFISKIIVLLSMYKQVLKIQ